MQTSSLAAGAAGLLLGVAAVFAEIGISRISWKRMAAAILGGAIGLSVSLLGVLALTQLRLTDSATERFSALALLLFFTYFGLAFGARNGDLLKRAAPKSGNPATGAVSDEASPLGLKILDTSVIIDGRIADLADTGFLDGILVIPEFVLRELQLVADSSDSMKRNRGRRGLDVLQRIQKMANSTVRIVEEDFPQVREVDLKLIELAKVYKAKIVTNDFNLNKVAQLRGVEVLNVNELANALKPIVLPGETMRVFILKEGKEFNQGVAYLDDGTMVVVDNAKRMISKTIDITVTSVLQTTAGKMIFGKHDATHAITAERPARKEHAVGEG
jgi:uncharacterized protein YacL